MSQLWPVSTPELTLGFQPGQQRCRGEDESKLRDVCLPSPQWNSCEQDKEPRGVGQGHWEKGGKEESEVGHGHRKRGGPLPEMPVYCWWEKGLYEETQGQSVLEPPQLGSNLQ